MNWTKEQREAIGARGSLIVSAAAGAGKTAVLTERLCCLVAAGTEVSRLLVLTFTRAAAAEMKNRIAKRLLSLSAEAEDDEKRRYLSAQSHAVTGANISTIHAFCARVVRRHSHTLALSPKMRVADEMEAAALKEQTRDELLDRLGETDDPNWHRLLAAFGGEKKAFDTVLGAYDFLLTQPDSLAWLDRAVERYGDGRALLLETAGFAGRELLPAIGALAAAAEAVPEDWHAVRAVLDDDLGRLRALLLMEDYESYRAMLLDIRFETLRFPHGTDDADKTPFRAPREGCKELIREQRKRFRRAADEELACMRGAAQVLSSLSAVLRAYDEAFSQRKRERALMDYNDLERYTLEALEKPAVAAEYREKFDFVAVDEYQDSNRVQEAILKRVAREDNLFLVGDVKQSIYRFRQAEPALFLEKLSTADKGLLKRVDLAHNFRSGKAVIDCVNDIFSSVMRQDAGGVAYDARARLVSGGASEEGSAELHIIERALAEDDEDAHDAVVEARFAAARIHELMAADKGLCYGDIAVLLKYTTHAARFAATLAKNGVPCYAQFNGGYFDAIEVQVFLNLLRVIDNRRRDVPLLSVMRASIGGFSDAELAHVRARSRTGSFYEAAAACAAEDDALGQKLKGFFERLDRWREEALLLSIESLIGCLLDETGFYLELGTLPDGAARQANLDALLSKARAFERTGARGLYAFLRHIELAGRNAGFGAAQTASADVVRLLTVHKSKGLEFSVVFVCQLGARFIMEGNRAPLVLSAAQGAGLCYIDEAEHVKRDTAIRQSILSGIRLEELAEEMRVLYVAMTRAKRRLILCGCLSHAAEKLAARTAKPLPAAILAAKTPLDWLLMSRAASLPVTLYERSAWLAGEESALPPPMPPEDAAITRAVCARLAWRYPFAEAAELPAKTSVTQLEGARSPAFLPPAFMGGDAPDALSIGSAMHAALQRLPGQPLSPTEARAFITELSDRRLIGVREAEKLDADALSWYSRTPLYRRMTNSVRAERELSFVYAADASALYDTAAEERVLLQGVIDACFTEDGSWVLVDYKTDAPRPDDNESALAARHARQLGLYAAALSSLTGMPVSERCVVYLRLRKIVGC